MEITDIQFIEQGDFQFKVSFMYKDHNLETPSLQRSVDEGEVLSSIERIIKNWEEKRAGDNFEALKKSIAEQTLTVDKDSKVSIKEK